MYDRVSGCTDVNKSSKFVRIEKTTTLFYQFYFLKPFGLLLGMISVIIITASYVEGWMPKYGTLVWNGDIKTLDNPQSLYIIFVGELIAQHYLKISLYWRDIMTEECTSCTE